MPFKYIKIGNQVDVSSTAKQYSISEMLNRRCGNGAGGAGKEKDYH